MRTHVNRVHDLMLSSFRNSKKKEKNDFHFFFHSHSFQCHFLDIFLVLLSFQFFIFVHLIFPGNDICSNFTEEKINKKQNYSFHAIRLVFGFMSILKQFTITQIQNSNPKYFTFWAGNFRLHWHLDFVFFLNKFSSFCVQPYNCKLRIANRCIVIYFESVSLYS